MPGKHKPVDGFLSADRVYTIEGVRQAIGFGRQELANARMTGIVRPVLVNKRRIYFGCELIEYVKFLQRKEYESAA